MIALASLSLLLSTSTARSSVHLSFVRRKKNVAVTAEAKLLPCANNAFVGVSLKRSAD